MHAEGIVRGGESKVHHNMRSRDPRPHVFCGPPLMETCLRKAGFLTEITRISPDTGPEAPKHLSAPSRDFWAWCVSEYVLERHHLLLLGQALQAWDRAEHARRAIRQAGLFMLDSRGQPRAHPAVAIERDSRESFARLLRQLDLEGEPDASRRRRA
jgi:phage terminase small subunit